MIVNTHPGLEILQSSPWKFYLIGSRFVGKFDRDRSDYDYILECSSHDWHLGSVITWLKESGFKEEECVGYGPDDSLHGSKIWTLKIEGYPSVDVLPMCEEYAALRLKFFSAMKRVGDKSGLLALALKRDKAWPLLWRCLKEIDNV